MNPTDRKGRVTEIIAREAAQFITREASAGSLITVIRAEPASKHGDRILVFVSVFPEDKIQAALAFLERHRSSFSDYLKSHARLRPLPRVDFLLDNREKTGAPLGELPKA
ncbi:MAG: hypothetical protein WCW36_02240 [Candidatus Paceibacterota bacterium]|jgi:ribosome-binding factor A